MLDAGSWGCHRAIALPGTHTTVADMIEALRAVGGDEAVARVQWQRDPEIERIVLGWPVRFETQRATSLGFRADASVKSIIEAFVADELTDRCLG